MTETQMFLCLSTMPEVSDKVTRYSSFIQINSLDSPTFLDILSTGKHRFFFAFGGDEIIIFTCNASLNKFLII